MAREVMVAYCHPMTVLGTFMNCLVTALLWDREHECHVESVLSANAGPRISSARNDLVRTFLKHPERPDWLLMIDADMTFDPDIVDRFMEVGDPQDRPIVGGLAYSVGYSGELKPTFFVWRRNELGVEVAAKPTTWPDDQLLSVDGTGAACLFVHRSVYEKMQEAFGDRAHPWFAEVEREGSEYGEDITFCIRARKLGFPLFIAPWLQFGHTKTRVYDHSDYLAWREGVAVLGEDEMQYQNLRRHRLVPEREAS